MSEKHWDGIERRRFCTFCPEHETVKKSIETIQGDVRKILFAAITMALSAVFFWGTQSNQIHVNTGRLDVIEVKIPEIEKLAYAEIKCLHQQHQEGL
jgi:hypothetical protein